MTVNRGAAARRPAYTIGYTYPDLLEFAGPVGSPLRAATGWTRVDSAPCSISRQQGVKRAGQA
jgi:hypothetical protein